MSGKWKDSSRASELPSNWRKLRNQVLKRDDYSCQWFDEEIKRHCLEPATEVDHARDRNSHSIEDLQSLCHRHHNVKTQQEAAEARRLARLKVASSFRRREIHPGDL